MASAAGPGVVPAAKSADLNTRRTTRLVTVEPVVFMVLAVQGGFVGLRTLYVEHRLALSYNYTLPGDDVNGTCGVNATNDPTQVRIESETAIWVAYMKGVSVFLPLFLALVCGAVSDFIGRKPILILSATGHLVASAIFTSIAYFRWPLIYLVVGEIVLGVCGDSVVMESIAYAYVADIYAGQNRSFRIFLIEVVIYIGFGVAQMSVTSILQASDSNFFLTYLVISTIAVVNFLYVTVPCALPETRARRPLSRGLLRDVVAKIYRLLRRNENGRRLRLCLLVANMTLYELVYEAVYSVINIYGLGPPFCWSETQVGVYGVISNIVPALASLLAMKLLGLCMSEYWMIYIGFLSGIGLLVTTSLAETTPMLVYVATAVGIVRILPAGLLKFLSAQLVDQDEQGSLFGAIAVLSSVGKVLSPVVMNGIYSSTVKQGQPTVTFYVAAGILVIPLFINGFLHVTQPKRELEYTAVNSCADEEDNKVSA